MADVNVQIKQRNGSVWDNLFPRTKAELVIESTDKSFVTENQKLEWSGKQNNLGFTPENVANKNQPNGYVGLDEGSKIASQYLPDIAITDTFVVDNQSAMLALPAQTGDVCIRTDLSKSFILKAEPPTTLGNWQELSSPLAPVTSVNGKTGSVTLTKSDIGLSNVPNESKATMFTNPTFTGTVTMPTPAVADNSTKGATTAFVVRAVEGLTKITLSETEPTSPKSNDYWYEII